jgi:TolB protein
MRKYTTYLLFLFGVAAITCCTTKDKSLDLSDLKIAYNVYYDTVNGNYEVFIMNADGTGKKNISNSKGIDWVYYAYKDKIYFASDRDTTYRMYFLYEMDADGNNIRKVSDLRLEDSYMGSRKNGTELVVSGRIGKQIRQQLFLLNVKDGSYKQITTDTASSFSDPCFLPDGEQIAFRHRVDRRNFQNEKAELWMMNVNGTNKRPLTHYPDNDTTSQWHDYHAGPPRVIPNSNLVSYMSFQKGNYSIFSIPSDGNNTNQLTPDELNEGWHSWSPDGNYMVYDASDKKSTWYDIYLMKGDGSGIKKLTDDWRYEQGPVFVEPKRK